MGLSDLRMRALREEHVMQCETGKVAGGVAIEENFSFLVILGTHKDHVCGLCVLPLVISAGDARDIQTTGHVFYL